MSEIRFLVIFQAIMVTLTFLNMVTKTESRRAGSGSTVSISIEDVSTKLKIKKAGVRWGLKECQRLFKDELWDCSFYNKSVTGALPDFVQRTLPYANKETAFLHAITTAGILREIVSQCAANKITECICEKKAGRTSRCGNNLSFAMKATRNLTRNGK
ncbi:protein Wnt-16-like [Stylophora pistillata]|uniref:protein Wnt-16-like n=1 Tax=Stylophora pistillata TaxID=50429 RepID=UPI000C04BB96|nr:protein Wnt-16-like [Stylophora pistillata]